MKNFKSDYLKALFKENYPRPGICFACGNRSAEMIHFTKNTIIDKNILFSLNSFIEEEHFGCEEYLIQISNKITKEIENLQNIQKNLREINLKLGPIFKKYNCNKYISIKNATEEDIKNPKKNTIIIVCLYENKC